MLIVLSTASRGGSSVVRAPVGIASVSFNLIFSLTTEIVKK